MESENPYYQCDLCQDLSDCPAPDVQQNFLGTPLPPDTCPRPIDIMKATMKKQKRHDNKN